MKKITQLLSLLLTMTILMSACGDDDDDDNNDDNNDMDPVDMTLDINDPDVVTDEIVISNAEIVEGNPPAPSSDPDAPSLNQSEFDTDLLSIQGGSLLIDVSIQSGSVAGTFVQIVGADSYFDIPFNPSGRVLKRGRILQGGDDDPVVEIEIPDNLGTGTFCAEVCVYDEDTRVSNIVEVCVEITELGGSNSDFLTANSWKATGFEEEEDGVVDEYEIGELVVDTFTTSLVCADGTFEEVEVTESDRTDNLEITFAADGSVQVSLSEFERDLDFENSDCENQVYVEEEALITLDGSWSYNDTTKELTMALEVTSSTFSEEVGDLEVIQFKVEFNENSSELRLTSDEDDDGDGGETIILIPG